jgi:hypothetical protein
MIRFALTVLCCVAILDVARTNDALTLGMKATRSSPLLHNHSLSPMFENA